MKKNTLLKKVAKCRRVFLIALSPVVFVFLVFTAFNVYFSGKIFPGVWVGGVNVGGQKPSEAVILLQNSHTPPEKIILKSSDGSPEDVFEINTGDLDLNFDYIQSVDAAFNHDRTGNIFFDLYNRLKSPFRKDELGFRFVLNEDALSERISSIGSEIGVEAIYPTATIVKGEVVVTNGKGGLEMDRKMVRITIGYNLAFNKNEAIEIKTMEINPALTDEQMESYKERAQKFLDKSLSIKHEYQQFTYKADSLIKYIEPEGEYKNELIEELIEEIAKEVNRPPQNSVFIFEGGRVSEFAPSRDGVEVKKDVLADMISGNLRTLETSEEKTLSIEIPATRTEPKIKTQDVNNLGITELIGRGTSRFAGSIATRVHNIALASSRFKGVLLEPGQVMSFNETLGDVSQFTGYKQAYIIQDGKTVLGDGGGVCQVSTTLFRAALNAGLPIIERRAHSYRVGYYEQDSPVGLDATVFAPTTDLKIKNDTPNHILIQTVADTKRATLVFEIYGTSDGRVASVSKPVVTNVTPPPEDAFQDDPALPEGTVKQVEYKAWGAKSTFNYSVTRSGEVIFQKTFVSNYKPWGAVFLRGTAPAN